MTSLTIFCSQTNFEKIEPRIVLPIKDVNAELKKRLIIEVVKRTLIELAISLAIAGAVCLFVVTPVGVATALIGAVAVVSINTIFRSANAGLEYKIQQLRKEKENPEKHETLKKCKLIQRFTKYLAPITFANGYDMHTRDVLVHEAGHAVAAKLLIKKPDVKVALNPYAGGVTSFRFGALTRLGEFFGRNNSRLIISAAGPALSICSAIASIAASFGLRNANPEISRYLRCMAISSIVQHVFYALSAFWATAANKGHDFLQLWMGGIHPLVSIAAMVAIPILVSVGFLIYDYHQKRIRKQQIQTQFS